MPDVFVSFFKKDAAVAQRISDKLQAHRVNVYQDQSALATDDSWSRAALHALQSSQTVVVLLSSKGAHNRWASDEVQVLLSSKKTVIGVLLDEAASDNWLWPLIASRGTHFNLENNAFSLPDLLDKVVAAILHSLDQTVPTKSWLSKLATHPLVAPKSALLATAFATFLLSTYQTGLWLAKYNILGSAYGSFALAIGILFIMLLSLRMAAGGSRPGVLLLLITALVNFPGNLNSFYVASQADALVRAELRSHRDHLAGLREEVRERFVDARLEKIALDAGVISTQLHAQIRDDGFGPLAIQELHRLEAILGMPITRITGGTSREERRALAADYEQIVEGLLRAKMNESGYLERRALIETTDKAVTDLSRRIDESLLVSNRFSALPNYTDEIVSTYRDICRRATTLTPPTSPPLRCDQNYNSPNSTLGSLSHTLRSVAHSLSDASTLVVLFLSSALTLIFPFIFYSMLVRLSDKRGVGVKIEDDLNNVRNGG